MNEGVVLYYEIPMIISPPITPVTQVDFLFLPTANLFVAFETTILADHNCMCDIGIYVTFHSCNKALMGLSFWNMNLNMKYQYLYR